MKNEVIDKPIIKKLNGNRVEITYRKTIEEVDVRTVNVREIDDDLANLNKSIQVSKQARVKKIAEMDKSISALEKQKADLEALRGQAVDILKVGGV